MTTGYVVKGRWSKFNGQEAYAYHRYDGVQTSAKAPTPYSADEAASVYQEASSFLSDVAVYLVHDDGREERMPSHGDALTQLSRIIEATSGIGFAGPEDSATERVDMLLASRYNIAQQRDELRAQRDVERMAWVRFHDASEETWTAAVGPADERTRRESAAFTKRDSAREALRQLGVDIDDLLNESGDSTARQCPTVRIGFDIGGVLSKYPEALALFRACLASPGFGVHIVTDMPKDKALKMLRLNGIDIDPAYVHACDYAEHGEECKAEKAKELGLDVLIDDFVSYVSIPGAPALRLLAMPDAARDYYHPDWDTDGAEGDFGRRKKRPVAETKAAPDESDIWQSDAIPYCKVCHKTHGAVRGEKMCGGPGSWIEDS